MITVMIINILYHHLYVGTTETNDVSMAYSVSAILYLQYVLHVMLFHMIHMFCILH